MAPRQIDKPVVVHFLESTKEVLGHISAWTVELSTRGQEGGKSLNLIYGTTRRLRDYLQRSLSAFPQPVKVDLSEADENVLVSCFLHSISTLDAALAKNIRALSERALLEQKRTVLSEWCIEFATKTPERIPVANKVEANTPTARGVLASIAKKVAVLKPGQASTDVAPIRVLHRGADPGLAPHEEDPQVVDPPRPKIETLTSALMNANQGACSDEQPTPQVAATQTSRAHDACEAGPTLDRTTLDSEVSPPWNEPVGIVDTKRIRDPRVRSMVTLDQRSFDRALGASDFRLALVHLYSIFEAGVIDHGLAHRAEFGLQGNVETWTLEAILQKALGERFLSADRTMMIQLVSARSLIRPAIQLTSPLAVTQASLLDAIALVRRMFVELGLAGSGGATAAADAKGRPGLVAARGDGTGWSNS